MTMIQLIACAGMITGFFFLLHLRPVEFTDELFAFLLRKPDTLKEEINQVTKQRKPGVFRREIMEAQEILVMTGRGGTFSLICAASLSLFAIGGSIATVSYTHLTLPTIA